MKTRVVIAAGAALVVAAALTPLGMNVSGSGTALGAASSLSAAAAKKYKNCTQLNKVYPHGIGQKGARDVVRGSTTPVTTFTVSNSIYKANKKSDRDKDGVACEKL
jgi:hypothetical protein